MAKKQDIYENAVVIEDGDIESTITKEVNDNLHEHCHTDNSGHGAFEHFGNRGYDKGTDYAVLEDYDLAVDITSCPEADGEHVAGNGNYVIGDVFGKHEDESYRIDWIAEYVKTVHQNGKIYGVYYVRSR